MRPFEFTRVADAQAAILAYNRNKTPERTSAVGSPTQYLAGGTTLLDLMKLDIMRPTHVVEINALQKAAAGRIEFDAGGVRLGAMRMADAADHPEMRKNFPVLAQSLKLAASQQIRNMASLGGNVLQRTRCTYFRVHALTREIRVPRIVGAFAAGRIMNPRTARSQHMGGMIWGVSSALHEATEIDPRNGRYVNDNLADYIIPVNADIQELEVILVPEKGDSVNPAGVKGLGERANVGTAAAVANAVYHATGIRVRQLPIRLENLLTS